MLYDQCEFKNFCVIFKIIGKDPLSNDYVNIIYHLFCDSSLPMYFKMHSHTSVSKPQVFCCKQNFKLLPQKVKLPYRFTFKWIFFFLRIKGEIYEFALCKTKARVIKNNLVLFIIIICLLRTFQARIHFLIHSVTCKIDWSLNESLSYFIYFMILCQVSDLQNYQKRLGYKALAFIKSYFNYLS